MEDIDLGEGLKVMEVIGQGSSGIVYRAVYENDPQPVAVKYFDRSQNHPILPFHEISVLIDCRDPHLVEIRDARYLKNGDILICYEFIPGGSLRDRLHVVETLSPDSALDLCNQILAGLAAIHSRGILHSDLKPENILIDTSGDRDAYKISDLGTAVILKEQNRFSSGQRLVGSPAYMAPERFFDVFGINSDLYSLGIILFEVLTGDLPFAGPPEVVARSHFNDRPPVERIADRRFREWISSLLEKKPGIRPSDARAAIQLKDRIFGSSLILSIRNGSAADSDPVRPPTAQPEPPSSQWHSLGSFTLQRAPNCLLALSSPQGPFVVCESEGTAMIWNTRRRRVQGNSVLGPERILRVLDPDCLLIASYSGIEIVQIPSDTVETLLPTSGLVWDLDGDPARERFVAAIENRVVYLDQEGNTLWKMAFPRYGFGQNIRIRDGGQGVVLSTGPLHNRIAAYDAEGNLEWKVPVSGPVTNLSWWEGSAYALVLESRNNIGPVLYRVDGNRALAIEPFIGGAHEYLRESRQPTILRRNRTLEGYSPENGWEGLGPALPPLDPDHTIASRIAASSDHRCIARLSILENTATIEAFIR